MTREETLSVIDWKKPIEYMDNSIPVTFAMSKTEGEFRHLCLVGEKNLGMFVDDYGRIARKGSGATKSTRMTMVRNVTPRPEPMVGAPAKVEAVEEIAELGDLVEELKDTIDAQMTGLRRQILDWTAQTTKLQESVKAAAEMAERVASQHQSALLDANMMLLEEMRKFFPPPPAPAVPDQVPPPYTQENPQGRALHIQAVSSDHMATVVNFEYLAGRPARQAVIRIAKDPNVTKVICGSNHPRGKGGGRIIEGYVEYRGEGQHGELIAHCNDREYAIELRIFLKAGADWKKVDGLAMTGGAR